MYGLYKEARQENAQTIINACTISNIEEELMMELLKDIKIFHPEYNNVKSILDIPDEDINKLRISPSQLLFINSYKKSITIIKANVLKANTLSTIPTTLVQFSFILYTFNKLLWKAMIEKAYIFKHPFIGKFLVLCREDAVCRPSINWKDSNNNRKTIIENGNIPKIELEARTADFNNQDYKGEDWVTRHKPFNLRIKWQRSSYAGMILPTIRDYNMKLCKTSKGNGVVDALKAMNDNNKLEDLLIKYYRTNE